MMTDINKLNKRVFVSSNDYLNYERKLIEEKSINNKIEFIDSLSDVFDKLNICDGMTLSFHHHLRNGDYVLNKVMEVIKKRNLKDMIIAPSSIFPSNGIVAELIRNGNIVKIYTNYISGEVGKAIIEGSLRDKVYKEQNFGGVRREAALGFPSVKSALNVSTSTLVTLVNLIIISEDSVLFKRCKTKEKYNQVKEVFKHLNCNDLEEVRNLTEEMIEENLSFGGSADLLVCTLFIRLIQSQYNLN